MHRFNGEHGRLAQLVQSICLTSRGSGVRIPQRPHKPPLRRLFSSPLFTTTIRTNCIGKKWGQQQKSVELLKYNGLVGAGSTAPAYPDGQTRGHTGRSRTPWYWRPFYVVVQ